MNDRLAWDVVSVKERAIWRGPHNETEKALARNITRRYAILSTAESPGNWQWPIEIRTLGSFEILRNGERLQFNRKVPKRGGSDRLNRV